MRAFVGVLAFELGYHARRPFTHIGFGIYFLASVLLMLSAGGALGGRSALPSEAPRPGRTPPRSRPSWSRP